MIELEFLRGLISAVDESGIDSLEISRAGTRIRIAKTPPAAAVVHGGGNSAPAGAHMYAGGGATAAPSPPAAAAGSPAAPPAPSPSAVAPAADSNLVEIRSPMVGTFYRSPSPEAPPYVEVGTRVGKGQTLCILEAMKLMNELEAEIAGVIREIVVENAEPVEYGQVLFRIEPSA
jgi:acetyl-CoA carboxylase biotin carboxyl carrier protein